MFERAEDDLWRDVIVTVEATKSTQFKGWISIAAGSTYSFGWIPYQVLLTLCNRNSYYTLARTKIAASCMFSVSSSRYKDPPYKSLKRPWSGIQPTATIESYGPVSTSRDAELLERDSNLLQAIAGSLHRSGFCQKVRRKIGRDRNQLSVSRDPPALIQKYRSSSRGPSSARCSWSPCEFPLENGRGRWGREGEVVEFGIWRFALMASGV